MSKISESTYEIKGQKIKISSAGPEDAKELINYMEQVFGETKFLLREPEEFEMTVEEEEEFLENMNQSENNLLKCMIILLANIKGIFHAFYITVCGVGTKKGSTSLSISNCSICPF